ncbi:hypothetical protein AE621_20205 [Acidovorax sp. SD340]|nr:hypothetical protein AE621_20205 [Acidovorax sp. SD340]
MFAAQASAAALRWLAGQRPAAQQGGDAGSVSLLAREMVSLAIRPGDDSCSQQVELPVKLAFAPSVYCEPFRVAARPVTLREPFFRDALGFVQKVRP